MKYRLLTAEGVIVHQGNHDTPAMRMIWVDDEGRRREFRAKVVIGLPRDRDPTDAERAAAEVVYVEVEEPT